LEQVYLPEEEAPEEEEEEEEEGDETLTALCADGAVANGTRVNTRLTEEEGGNGEWYEGTIVKLWKNGDCEILYDDGDRWTGSVKQAYLWKTDDGAAF